MVSHPFIYTPMIKSTYIERFFLESVTLKSASPFTIGVTGLVSLDSGPLPNQNIDFEAVFVFSGPHPADGQLQSVDQTIVGISKDHTPPSTATPTTSSAVGPSNSTKDTASAVQIDSSASISCCFVFV